jgi:hypothetical protein
MRSNGGSRKQWLRWVIEMDRTSQFEYRAHRTRFTRRNAALFRALVRFRHSIARTLLLTLLGGYAIPRGEAARLPGDVQAPDFPTVEVSLVTVDPSEVSAEGKSGEAVAWVTVQMHHHRLGSEQKVTLIVGSYSTSPPGIQADYVPQIQTVRLPRGNSDVVAAKVKVSGIHVSGDGNGKVIIIAKLTDPSAGIRIVRSDPANDQATLTIRSK